MQALEQAYPALATARPTHIQLCNNGKWADTMIIKEDAQSQKLLDEFLKNDGNVGLELWFAIPTSNGEQRFYIGITYPDGKSIEEKKDFFSKFYQAVLVAKVPQAEMLKITASLCAEANIGMPSFRTPSLVALGVVNAWNEVGELIIEPFNYTDLNEVFKVVETKKPALLSTEKNFIGLEAQFKTGGVPNSWISIEVSKPNQKGFSLLDSQRLQQALAAFGYELNSMASNVSSELIGPRKR